MVGDRAVIVHCCESRGGPGDVGGEAVGLIPVCDRSPGLDGYYPGDDQLLDLGCVLGSDPADDHRLAAAWKTGVF